MDWIKLQRMFLSLVETPKKKLSNTFSPIDANKIFTDIDGR